MATPQKQKKEFIPFDDSEDQNPLYIFTLTSNHLLAGIIKGEIDIVELAKRELDNRGYNTNCEWVGFKKAQ